MAKEFKSFKSDQKTPGVVIWFLKQGISIPVTTLRKTLRTLRAERVDDGGWFDSKRRVKEIKREIKIIQQVISTGKVPKRLKVKGIFD